MMYAWLFDGREELEEELEIEEEEVGEEVGEELEVEEEEVGRRRFACNINVPACNTDAILSYYKLKYSKNTVISILYACVYLDCTTAN